METYTTEDEQIEQIKKWWGENGASIVVGVVLGLGTLFGWRWWTDTKGAEAEAVSDLYQSFISSTQEDERAISQGIADDIINDYPSTPYAVFAKLALASEAVSDVDYLTALTHLRSALDNVNNESLEKEVRLRIARVLVAQNNFTEALATIDAIEPGAYKGAYEDLRGDIRTMQGDIDGAREAYQNAIIEMRMLQSDTQIVEFKLNDLGRP